MTTPQSLSPLSHCWNEAMKDDQAKLDATRRIQALLRAKQKRKIVEHLHADTVAAESKADSVALSLSRAASLPSMNSDETAALVDKALSAASDAEELAKTAAVERKRLREEERLKDEKEDRKREQEQLQKKLEVEPVQLLLFLLVF